MAENLPSSSGSSRLPSSPPVDENSGQSLSWSFHNFPVPVQFQPRIPRSPLSVAQELLPNFPSHLMGSEESAMTPSQMSNHQCQLALQQQVQQQLQQQFQRQLQLNLQGGRESSRGAILPDPPDTTVDIDSPISGPTATSGNTFVSHTSAGNASSDSGGQNWTGSGVGGGLRSALMSSRLNDLRGLFRYPQAASVQQRNNGSASQDSGRNSNSRNSASSIAQSQIQQQPHHHHHHHSHSLTDSQPSVFDSIGGTGSNLGAGDGASNMVPGSDLQQIATGNGVVPGGGGNNAGGTGALPRTPTPAELSLVYKWLAESGVFAILLLLHFLYDHRLGLLVFLCTGGTFYYTNMKLVHAIHQSAIREQSRMWLGLLNLLWLSGFLIANVIILYYVFAEQKLWRLLLFHMATVPDISVWTLLWCVVMTDYIIKFLTVVVKALLTMMQPCFHNYRKRGKYYQLIESISQLYRQLVTIVPWLYYLNDSTRTGFWFAFLTEAVYLGFKGWNLRGCVRYLYSSIQSFQSNTSFGKKPSSSDLLERGNQCPICQDTISEPVMLPCKHIFCERCVSIWFDREKTCPMCRAEIMIDSPLWRDGNTSDHLQWF